MAKDGPDPSPATLTRLAPLGTLSRNAGEGLRSGEFKAPLPHRGRGGTKPAGLGGSGDHAMIPGELLPAPGDIEINSGRAAITLTVANTGDRPVQVGSHFHFYETNSALAFDRERARGCRLDIPAGTAMRFEPGQSRKVRLVAYAGDRRVVGFNGRVNGRLG